MVERALNHHERLEMGLALAMTAQWALAWPLFFAFALLTVRRLRKDPRTRDLLGLEFFPGGAVLNVSRALAVSRKFARRCDHGGWSDLHANSEAIYAATARWERVLGRAQFWSHCLAALTTVLWLIVEKWF